MTIDWFTFVAQIVNFLILMGLLWRFLYQPIMAAMSRREDEIASRFQDAESKRKKAEEQIETYKQKNQELKEQRHDLLSEAKDDARQEKQKMLDQARDEVDRAREKWQTTLDNEQQRVLNHFRERAGQGVCSGLRQALQDLADADLEPHITDAFVRRLRSLDDEQRQDLQESLDRSHETPQIVSAFDLSQKKQKEITQAVRKALERDVSPQFRQASEVTCGVELRTDGHKIAWSVAGFIADIEENLNDWLAQQRQGTDKSRSTEQSASQSDEQAEHQDAKQDESQNATQHQDESADDHEQDQHDDSQ